MKKILNIKNIILTALAVVLILFIVFTLVIIKSDYSFKLNFNNEEMKFFNKETLYFNEAVNINFYGKGYTAKLNGDKFKNNIDITEDGIYTLELSKLLKHYYITINMNSKPDIYLVDSGGNIIHNYLSNNNPFKVVKSSSDVNVYINNMTYTDDSVIETAGDYVVSTDDNTYTVNILSIEN